MRRTATYAALFALTLYGALYGQTLIRSSGSGGAGGGDTVNAPVAFASIPACAASEFFQPLNNSVYDLVYCNGSSTLSYYRNGTALTPPVNGDYSWDNQGTATVDATYGSIMLEGPASSSDNVRLRYKTAPETPYTITALVRVDTKVINFASAGLAFRQSSDGKIVTHGWDSPTPSLVSQKYTNSTTLSATYTQVDEPLGQPNLIWFRIADNNTNRIFSYSFNGTKWTQVHSVGRTDFLTADQVGFFVNPKNATYSARIEILSWLEE